MTDRRPSALLVDMDGVVRIWDPAFTAGVEQRHGLAPGSLIGTLFQPDLLRAATLGKLSDADWLAQVSDLLGSSAAVRDWLQFRGTVDQAVLALVREVRAAGVPVALATNATDRLDADLAILGLTGEFDAVVNSSVLGAAKPSPEFYAAACQAVRRPPASCLLVDDIERNVAGARAAGLYGHRWTGAADIPYLRAALGLPRA